jgi:hypothetical protein
MRLVPPNVGASLLPHGWCATRPCRGSVSRDRAHPMKTKSETRGKHGRNVGCGVRNVKRRVGRARGENAPTAVLPRPLRR